MFNSTSTPIFTVAIKNAAWHGINLKPGWPNNADGNCIIEAIVDNVNNRNCFNENFSGSPDSLRYLWLTKAERHVYNFTGGLLRPLDEFKSEWAQLKTSRSYECDFGDFVPHAIAHCIQKDILIFNSHICVNRDPIYVVEASKLDNRTANTPIPIILAYNGVHYESLLPMKEEDIEKSIALKIQYINNQYTFTKNDIPVFQSLQENQAQKHSNSKFANKKSMPDVNSLCQEKRMFDTRNLNDVEKIRDFALSEQDMITYFKGSKENSNKKKSYASIVRNGLVVKEMSEENINSFSKAQIGGKNTR